MVRFWLQMQWDCIFVVRNLFSMLNWFIHEREDRHEAILRLRRNLIISRLNQANLEYIDLCKDINERSSFKFWLRLDFQLRQKLLALLLFLIFFSGELAEKLRIPFN